MKINILFLLILINIFTTTYAQEITLKDFLQKVEIENLQLKTEKAQLTAVDELSSGIKIPAPSINLIQKTLSDDDSKGFELMQEIPYPGKISSDKEYRKEALKSQSFSYLAEKNKVLASAKFSFISYCLQLELLKILQDKRAVIVDHLKLARSAVRSDSMLKVHLLKAESDLDALDGEMIKQNQILSQLHLNLVEFINQSKDYKFAKPKAPSLSKIPKWEIENSPQVQELKHKVLMAQAKESGSKKEWLPDFKIAVMKMDESRMMAKFTQVSVGITLPFLLPWNPRSISSSDHALKLSSQYQLEKTSKKIEFEKINMENELKSLIEQMNLVESKLIPRAHERMRVVHNIAPRDMASLQDHREVMESFTNLQMELVGLKSRYEYLIATLVSFATEKEVYNE